MVNKKDARDAIRLWAREKKEWQEAIKDLETFAEIVYTLLQQRLQGGYTREEIEDAFDYVLEGRNMSYISKDEQILFKIRRYMDKLSLLYNTIAELSDAEIDEGIEGLALAQCMTNLFELASIISNDVVATKLSVLSSGRTSGFRNVAAHYYDANNWSIAKKNCKLILSTVTQECLNECVTELDIEKANTKDYTKNSSMNSDPYKL